MREKYTEIIVPSEVAEDPYPLFAEWRRETPVRDRDVMVELGVPTMTPPGINGGRANFTLFRYDDCISALRDGETFSNAIFMELIDKFMGTPDSERVERTVDPEQAKLKTFMRGMLLDVFSRKELIAWDEEVIVPAARRCVEQLAAEGKSADLVDYALSFPMHMIYGPMGISGVPDEALDRVQEMSMARLIATPENPDKEKMAHDVQLAREANAELMALVLPIVERKRAEGATGGDLISRIIRSDLDGRTFDDAEIAQQVIGNLQAATENTSRQFLNTMTCLLQRPEVLASVRDDRTLMTQAVMEGERYEPSVIAFPRLVTRDVEVRGTTMPAGSTVSLNLGSANRDPDVFPDPETFDIQRKGKLPLTFGFGAHICPGMNIVRVEVGAAIGALFDLLPNLRLDPDEEPPRINGALFRGPASLPVVWD